MDLREMMTRDVVTVLPDETLTTAAEKMARHDTGMLPVCVGDQILGVLTDRDIVVRGLAKHLDPEVTLVRECMSGQVETIEEDASIRTAADRMESEQIRRLVVVDRSQRLVGVVALADLSAAVQESEVGQTLRGISEPAASAH